MAELFQRHRTTILKHIKNVFEEGELDANVVCANFAHTTKHGAIEGKAHIPMYMKDWVQKLDDFLRLSNRELLTHAGKISAEIAKQKADAEYAKFRERTKYELSPVEIHFIDQFEAEQKKLKGK